MAKINSTYGAGYRIDHDFDARKFEEQQKKEKRSRTQADLDKEATKRQTWMLPFNLLCDHCGKRIGRATKVYANVKKLGKERKYLNKISVFSLTIRCIFCSGKIVFETDPEAGDYNVVAGGQRTEGDWKELRDQANQEAEKAQALDDEMGRQQALLEESQKNAEKAEELAKLLDARSKHDVQGSIDKALERLHAGGGGGHSGGDQLQRERHAIRGNLLPGAGLDDDDGADDADDVPFDEAEWEEALAFCTKGTSTADASTNDTKASDCSGGKDSASVAGGPSSGTTVATKFNSSLEGSSSASNNKFMIPADLRGMESNTTAGGDAPQKAKPKKKKSALSRLADD